MTKLIMDKPKKVYTQDGIRLYPLESLFLAIKWAKKLIEEEKKNNEYYRIMAIDSGEFRPAKKGEFYLSGAIPCAYRSLGNSKISNHIAKLVLVKKVYTQPIITIEREDI